MDFNQFDQNINQCLSHLEEEMSQIRTGRAAPELLYSVRVEAYGTINPIKNLANFSVADAKSLIVQPWDKSLVQSVIKAISTSDLGVSASVEGDSIRVRFPDLTEERRRDFVKMMKDRVENARIAVRNVRQKYMKEVEDEVKGGLSEDEGKRIKADIEKTVKEINDKIEEVRESKEKELMTV